MSFNDKICNLDIINIIFKLCDSIDSKTVLACISKTLNKLLQSKVYFALNQNNLRQISLLLAEAKVREWL